MDTTQPGADNALDLDAIEAAARAADEAAEEHGAWLNAYQLAEGVTLDQFADFIAAANPQSVLALIALARRAAQPVEAEGAVPAFWYSPTQVERQPLQGDAEMLTITGSNVKWGEWTTPLYATHPAEPVAPQGNPWHEAVLAECMRIEAAYQADDPVATLKALIDWHAHGSDTASTNKVLADNYIKLTCSGPVGGALVAGGQDEK